MDACAWPRVIPPLARKYLMEHGGSPRDASWFARVQSSNETQTVALDKAIPMHVAQ